MGWEGGTPFSEKRNTFLSFVTSCFLTTATARPRLRIDHPQASELSRHICKMHDQNYFTFFLIFGSTTLFFLIFGSTTLAILSLCAGVVHRSHSGLPWLQARASPTQFHNLQPA